MAVHNDINCSDRMVIKVRHTFHKYKEQNLQKTIKNFHLHVEAEMVGTQQEDLYMQLTMGG